MKRAALFSLLSLSLLACGSEPGPRTVPGNQGGEGGDDTGGMSGGGSGGKAGTGGGGRGSAGVGGGAGAGGSGGAAGSSGGAGSGGAAGTGGNGGAGGGGSGGAAADAGAPDSGTASDGSAGDAGGPGPTAPGQGPTALGKIVFSQDFENGTAGFTRSPTNLPADRVQIVDDPLGQRGKVAKIIWQAGDNYRTSSGTQPRSWYSNASGYQIKPGTKTSQAWGFMWDDVNFDAFFAQNIGPGPVWEARVRANGRFQILCNQCGGNTPDMMLLQPKRWYDFRVDMDWGGGQIKFFIDGQMVHTANMGGASANCHWDGGIYNTPGGTASNKTRVVYLSNLSMGER